MKKFKKLQTLMFGECFTQKDLARSINKSPSYISSRMVGRQQWELEDIYKTCDLLEIPYEEICLYFPRNGVIKAVKVKEEK